MPGERLFRTAAALLLFVVCPSVGFPGRSAAASAEDAVDFHGAVDRALRNNASLRAARHGITSAWKEAESARGAYLPKLTFEERFLRTNVPAEAFAFKLNQERFTAADFDPDTLNRPPPTNDFVTLFRIEQPVFAPRAYLGYEMARREAEATEKDVARMREEVVFRVLSSCLDVLSAKEYVRVADLALSDAREHLRIAEAKEGAGTGLVSDVLRARVFLAAAESGKVTAENRLALAQTALGLAMGEAGGTRVDVLGPPPPLPEPGTLRDRIAAAREGRSDLRAFSMRIANAETGVTLERSDYLPALGVAGTYQLDGEDNPFSPDNRSWKIGVGVTWNLFDGLRREAQVAKASAERGRAGERYREAVNVSAFQVTRAHLSVGEAARRVEIARAAAAAAEEGTRIVRSRYENQLARMIDLLDAQTALNGARADLARAENDLLQSRAQLEFASGTLLQWATAGPGAPE